MLAYTCSTVRLRKLTQISQGKPAKSHNMYQKMLATCNLLAFALCLSVSMVMCVDYVGTI